MPVLVSSMRPSRAKATVWCVLSEVVSVARKSVFRVPANFARSHFGSSHFGSSLPAQAPAVVSQFTYHCSLVNMHWDHGDGNNGINRSWGWHCDSSWQWKDQSIRQPWCCVLCGQENGAKGKACRNCGARRGFAENTGAQGQLTILTESADSNRSNGRGVGNNGSLGSGSLSWQAQSKHPIATQVQNMSS